MQADAIRARLQSLPSPLQLLRSQARLRGSDSAVVAFRSPQDLTPRSLTYSQLLERVEGAAAAWVASGIAAGDGIAILLPHTEDSVIALLAAMSVAVAFPLNPLLSTEALSPQLRLAAVKSAVIPNLDWAGGARSRFLAAASNVPCLRHVLAVEAENEIADGESWTRFMHSAPSHILGGQTDVNRAAALFHTGGTTGAPKLAELSQRNIAAGAIMSATGWNWRPEDRIISCLPLFHVGGAITTMLATLAAGGTVILPSALGARDPELIKGIWEFIDRTAATILLMVPTSLSAVVDIPRGHASLVSLRAVATGAAALSSELCRRVEQLTGVPLAQGFGMTELAGVGALQPCDGQYRQQAVGFPVPLIQMRIDSGESLSHRGEVCWNGPNIFRGYRMGDGLRGAPVDGWLRSGDIGEIGADGQLNLRGRLKDIIIRSGHNIDPVAIEEAALSHPAVLQAVAVPMPDDYAGEVPALYVCLHRSRKLTIDELMAHVAARVFEPPARPQFIFILPELPLTPTGKYARYRLRQLAVEWRVRDVLKNHSHIRIACNDVAGKSVSLDLGTDATPQARTEASQTLSRFGRTLEA